MFFEKIIKYFALITAACFLAVNLAACNFIKTAKKDTEDINYDGGVTTTAADTAAGEEHDTYTDIATDDAASDTAADVPAADTETAADDVPIPDVIYSDDLIWYVNDDIASLGFAEMYISAAAKRTDPKFAELRDPEIHLIHLIGEDGANKINAVIDKTVTEPYREYIEQIQSGNYTSETLFFCQSSAVVYEDIAVIEIGYWTYDGTKAMGIPSETAVFYYDHAEDKALTVTQVLESAGIDDETFLSVLSSYCNKRTSAEKNYTFADIEWLLPTAKGITVCVYLNVYDEFSETFTITYPALT